jgi:hypothetical protein
VWHFFAPLLPEAQQAIEKIDSFMRETTSESVMNARILTP